MNRQLTPTCTPCEPRITLSASPVMQLGGTVAILGGPHAVAITSVPREGVLEVDYGTHGFDGPLTAYTFNLATVRSIVYAGFGDDQYGENDTNVVPEAFLAIGNDCTYNGSLEDDTVVLLGSGNSADGGGGNDLILIR